ncbi:MAG: DUF6531 domain-containing protein, partial [Thermoanaerobaculia bacterium]
ETYTLLLDPSLKDASGNTWGDTVAIDFDVVGTTKLDTFELDARDVARLGSWLFVAADAQGLVVLDASDPAKLKEVVPNTSFAFPLNDPVSGVDVDPHGRVLVVGGGAETPGQLKIFDPLDVDPDRMANNDPSHLEAWNGSTLISDSLSAAQSGTSNPAGRPRRVSVLSNDQIDKWLVGGAPPAGITVSPTEPPEGVTEYVLTVSGSGAGVGAPVTLRDLTLGRWNRTDADSGGTFAVSLEVQIGDRLELLRNQDSIAYVATLGVGVEVVDVNAFYNEAGTPPILSDVVGIYNGYGDALQLCNQTVSDIGGALLDLETVLDLEDEQHPLTVAGLVGFRGLLLLESELTQPDRLSFLNEQCAELDGSRNVSGLEVVQDYHFANVEKPSDYALLAHRAGAVLVFDIGDRENIRTVGIIRLPGAAAHLSIDRERRLLYVSAYDRLYLVDFDLPPTTELLDANEDGVDDRVLETIELGGSTNSPILLAPELGLAFAAGLESGLTSLATGGPGLVAVTKSTAGSVRPIARLAPFGVPTASVASNPALGDLPGSFQIQAVLPGDLGSEFRFDVLSQGPGGQSILGGGKLAEGLGLPSAALIGDNGVILKRQADNPWEPGYQIYRSGEVAALADLRASEPYTRTEREKEQCIRCDVPEDAWEILSGPTIALRFPEELRQLLSPIYGSERLDSAEIDLASVRWETSPSLRQEPTLNPSYGSGDIVPGTLLHSGEMSMSATDLYLKGRGFDFAFTRTYRNQTVGSGPLGPGCDHSYNRRLRELPNGDVDYYDGRGRRELFAKTGESENGEIVYRAPVGRFWELKRTGAGWVLVDQSRNLIRFDRSGRLISVADFVKDSEETGNEMRFYYDLDSRLVRLRDTLDRDILFTYNEAGRLAKIVDFDGREVSYDYDGHGRLVTVTSPLITTGLAQFPDGLVTRYGFAEDLPDTDLAAYLSQRDNLESVTDPKDQQWLTLLFDDQDGDGRAEEATAQEWGVGAVGLSYDFDSRTATVTDRRDNPWVYNHNPAGQVLQIVDPSTATFGMEYDEEGLEIRSVSPLGRVSRTSYADTIDRRSRGNPTKTEVTADERGANGSDPTLVTTIEYEHRANHPVRIMDPRGIVTKIERDALGLPETITRAVDEPEVSITRYEYNDFGQIEKVTNPNDHIATYEYFATGPGTGYLERQLVDPDSLKIETRYETDARGNVIAVIDPRAVKHESQWNEVDWLVEEKRATTASADGAPGLSYKTLFLYDANGNLTELRRPFGDTGEEFTRERYEYGVLDELLVTRREVDANQPEPDWVV